MLVERVLEANLNPNTTGSEFMTISKSGIQSAPNMGELDERKLQVNDEEEMMSKTPSCSNFKSF